MQMGRDGRKDEEVRKRWSGRGREGANRNKANMSNDVITPTVCSSEERVTRRRKPD